MSEEEIRKIAREELKPFKEKIIELKNINDKLSSALESAEQKIDKAIEYIKEYGRDKQLEEEYLMNAYNLAVYNTTLLDILDKANESEVN